ncbi:hypothetical protein C8A00DRAFT_12761 [Chaetomidium leptoderma]|uniref:Extracellular membrane protein CFEM domain-containing protein n=1 Tax=Chaetomidium leptoderma TaxID=669021 RepID=A0AAN6ZZV9_9PEZI|nr:hypothetical protein C8A00DRAFT_12761 [Chaetomidium leptoderma]
MLLGRMAYRLSLLCLTTWTILISAVAAAQTANITPEILNFVPTCAQACFDSFVSANFDARICGNSPSLQCLCRQLGNSGYTIGEGAASCLVGESRFGACQGQDGIATQTAYNMCFGVSKAEPQTHATIVATLVVPPSGSGPLLVPTAIQTATSTGTGAGTTSITPTPTVNLPTGDEPSSTTAAPTSVTSLTSSSTSTPAATASPEVSDEQPQLSSAQVAGITLGCAAVVVFGILLVLLAKCVRRRRLGDPEAGFSKMEDSTSFGRKSRPTSVPGFLISSPLPRVQAERNPADPRWQPSMKQGGVGLAISQPAVARGGVFARPSPALASALSGPLPPTPAADPVPAFALAPAAASRAIPKAVSSPPPRPRAPAAERSPPKPTLTLAIPNGQERVARMPANVRDSVVTEFAEDGEGELAPGTAIWRPPPTDPQSATAVYFSDKGGNWILRNASARKPEAGTSGRLSGPQRPVIQEVPAAPVEVELPSPDHKTRAERAKDAYGGFSPEAVVSPLRLPGRPGLERLGSPIAFKDQRREPQLSSPSLSARLSQTAETIHSESAQINNSRPADIYFGMMRESRDLTGGKNKRRSTKRASRRVSQGSVTSIESAGEDENVVEDEPQVDLSPVAESPHTPISPGKSPVSYPKIRKRNDGQQAGSSKQAPESDLLPPTHMYNVWHPPGHFSSTGASTMPPKTRTVTPAIRQPNGPQRPWNAPNLRPAPSRNPGQPRTGSPETRPGPVSPIEDNYWQHQRQVANPGSYWNQPQNQPARIRPPPPTPPYELPGENTPSRRYETPPPHQQQQQQQRRQQQRRPTRPTDMSSSMPTPAATPQQQQQPRKSAAAATTSSGGDTSSQGSLLLAKRRGAEKAAALTLGGGHGHGSSNGNGNGNGGQGGGRKKGSSRAGGWTREEEPSSSSSSLYGFSVPPITPGWVPELTPTRRGEDLYLNVR